MLGFNFDVGVAAEYGIRDQSLFSDILQLSASHIGCAAAVFSIRDIGDQAAIAAYGTQTGRIPAKKSFSALVSDKNKEILHRDLSTSDPKKFTNTLPDGRNYQFYLGMPIRTTEGKVFGTLSFYDIEPREPSERQLDEMRRFASLLEGILRLHKFAAYDELTGAFNRHFFFDHLEQEWGRAKRNLFPLTLAALDLDNFKSLNDSVGHAQGDLALKACVKSMRSILRRGGDVIARTGGDEFIVLMPNTDQRNGVALMERLRLMIENQQILADTQHSQNLTCSIGVSCAVTRKDQESLTWKVGLARADKALYTAKNKGRNRVVSYHPELPDIE